MATPNIRSDLPGPERNLLYADSGNECAFPGCGAVLVKPGEGSGKAVNVGEATHLVASSRQGPRGGVPLSDDERDTRASNRILLCPTHHTEVDTQPLVYTVEVLRLMKSDHERKHHKERPLVAAVAISDAREPRRRRPTPRDVELPVGFYRSRPNVARLETDLGLGDVLIGLDKIDSHHDERRARRTEHVHDRSRGFVETPWNDDPVSRAVLGHLGYQGL